MLRFCLLLPVVCILLGCGGGGNVSQPTDPNAAAYTAAYGYMDVRFDPSRISPMEETTFAVLQDGRLRLDGWADRSDGHGQLNRQSWSAVAREDGAHNWQIDSFSWL